MTIGSHSDALLRVSDGTAERSLLRSERKDAHPAAPTEKTDLAIRALKKSCRFDTRDLHGDT